MPRVRAIAHADKESFVHHHGSFAADPLTRWVLPQADMYLTHGISIFDPFEPAVSTLVPPTRYSALSAALWVPPHHKDRDEAAPAPLGKVCR